MSATSNAAVGYENGRSARNWLDLTRRRPELDTSTRPIIQSVTGIGTIPRMGVMLSHDADASYGDIQLQLGLNQVQPYQLVVRFPGTVTGGAPLGNSLFVAGAGLNIVQTDALPTAPPVNTTATAASAALATTVTVASAAGLVAGMVASDTTAANVAAIPFGTTIVSIAGLVVTLSAAVIAPGVAVGDALSFAIPQPFRTTSTAASAGTTTIAVASVTNFAVGMLIKDATNPAAIAPGTTIAAINALVLTLSAPIPIPGISLGDTLTVQNVTTDIRWTITLSATGLQLPYVTERTWIIHYEWSNLS